MSNNREPNLHITQVIIVSVVGGARSAARRTGFGAAEPGQFVRSSGSGSASMAEALAAEDQLFSGSGSAGMAEALAAEKRPQPKHAGKGAGVSGSRTDPVTPRIESFLKPLQHHRHIHAKVRE